MKLSIIIPTYNEHNTIADIIQYAQAVKYPIEHEVIIIDDASIDRTYEKEVLIRLKNKETGKEIRLFKNKINRGKSFSIRKGIKRATGDLFVVQDGDTEYDPNDIPKLLDPILKGEADIVCGSRFLENPHPEGMAFPNWIANRVLTHLVNFLYGLKLTDLETCYKVFKTDMLRDLKLCANRFEFDPEVIALLAKKGARIKELPISYKGRTKKEGKKIRAIDFFIAVWTLLRCFFVKLK